MIKTAVWALISIPITALGFFVSFALAHGAWPLMLAPLAPGLGVLWLFSDADLSENAFLVIAYTSQYISYFLIIFSVNKLRNKRKTKHEKNT